jgi:hypothetical protein
MTFILRSIVPANGQMGLLDKDKREPLWETWRHWNYISQHRTRGTYTVPNKLSPSDVPTIASLANSDLIPTTPSTKWPSNRKNVSETCFERDVVDRVLGTALPFIANFTAGAIAGVSEILTFYPLGGLFFLVVFQEKTC